eukprot:SAG31_NODE_3543_length_4142_cov_11.404622_3_plen_67_part_00
MFAVADDYSACTAPGRAQEVYGEDPIHMATLVTQFVTGAQNNSVGEVVDSNGYLQAGTCCKHFAGP